MGNPYMTNGKAASLRYLFNTALKIGKVGGIENWKNGKLKVGKMENWKLKVENGGINTGSNRTNPFNPMGNGDVFGDFGAGTTDFRKKLGFTPYRDVDWFFEAQGCVVMLVDFYRNASGGCITETDWLLFAATIPSLMFVISWKNLSHFEQISFRFYIFNFPFSIFHLFLIFNFQFFPHFQLSTFHFPFSIYSSFSTFNFFPIFNFQLSIFHFPFIPHFQLSIFNFQFPPPV